jgi:predicted MPP superfamily phosphohydrolase
MLPEESRAVTIFMISVATVYILAIMIFVRWTLSRQGLVKKHTGRLYSAYRLIVLVLAFAGIACMAYAYFVEPYWLTVRTVQLKTRKLPPGSPPMRLVHISDIHSDPKVRLEDTLPEVIAQQSPDLIVFSGDSLNSEEGLPVFRECLTRIAAIAPTFVVKGNWDSWYWSHLDLFGNTGATELDSETLRTQIRGVPISISGIPVGDEKQLGSVLASVPSTDLSIFVYHYPDLVEGPNLRNVDLYCAGHTHGGQIALPLYGALVTLSKFGKKYESGTYQVNDTLLNVNRGIGMEGGSAPRVRFWAWPEVTVIEISPE